jgi:hypothetical protein
MVGKLFMKPHRPTTEPFAWVKEHATGTGNILFIVFSSTPTGFEWQKTFLEEMQDTALNILFVLDASDVWWHGVYPGLDKHGILGLKDFLQEKISLCKPKKVITIGASRGGYAAVLLGCLLKVDTVLAFSPQKEEFYISLERYNMLERYKTIEGMYPGFKIDRTYMKLDDVLNNTLNDKTEYHIFYGNEHPEDTEVANVIKDIKPNQTILDSLKSSSHKVVKLYKKYGTINKILKELTKA